MLGSQPRTFGMMILNFQRASGQRILQPRQLGAECPRGAGARQTRRGLCPGLRTEPAYQEAFIHLGQRQPAGAGWQAVGDALYRWTLEQHRTPNGGPRMILIGVPSAGDPPGGRGPDFDFAVALR